MTWRYCAGAVAVRPHGRVTSFAVGFDDAGVLVDDTLGRVVEAAFEPLPLLHAAIAATSTHMRAVRRIGTP
jgi:hypothetical protein